ncbi:dicarboxylate/amino acid:cation symporter [Nocardioides sp. URHA0020]|uniref:dicarboxylate/amino acid:cation symporter n=1 Tax=Nocardioides sp. URHA0020 TaxID=1380392 RepID=UPI0018CBF2BB|nr:dicarboxylate/amino acid:cation symporter [Nocardioides sp. URHA0020]
MDTWALSGLAVTLGLFAGLITLSRRQVNFAVLTFIGLFLGIAVGYVFRDHVQYVDPLGQAYIKLLMAVVAPLVIVSILSSITSLGSTSQLKRIGGASIFWLLTLNLLAILLTLGLALQLGVGKGADLETQGVPTTTLNEFKESFTQVFLGFFPSNIVSDIAENNVIPIIIATVAVAVALSMVADRKPEQMAPVKALIDGFREIVFKVVGFVIKLTPYAVLALTAGAVSKTSLKVDTLMPLLTLLLVGYLACFIDAFPVNAVVLRVWGDVRPTVFFRKIFPAQLTAFTTQSSAGTLPVTTGLLTRKIGVPADIAGFTAPLGTTIGMPGCAGVWPMLLAVYAINGLGLSYGLTDYAVLILLALVVSLGTAGVPGTATVTATTVFAAAGLPLEVIILTLPISAIVDMARTLNNVTAAAVASVLVARREGRLDDAIFDAANDRTDDAPGAPQPARVPVVAPVTELPLTTAALFDTPFPSALVGACDITDRPLVKNSLETR